MWGRFALLKARLARARAREVSEVASILVFIVFHFGFQPLFSLQIWRVEVVTVVGLAWLPSRLRVDRYLSLYIYTHTHNQRYPDSRFCGLVAVQKRTTVQLEILKVLKVGGDACLGVWMRGSRMTLMGQRLVEVWMMAVALEPWT